MNKFKLLLSGVCLLFGLAANAENYLISTPNTTLFVEGVKGKQLNIQYYGSRIESADEVYDSGTALWQPAYPAFGLECTREPAIQVTHADGNMSLDLLFNNVEKSTEGNAQVWKFVLSDPVYPFQVKVCYKAFQDVDVIEAWTEISHSEKKPVTLYKFASTYIPLRDNKNWLSHLHGTWTAEGYLFEEELLPGIKVIKNKDGVRNGQDDNPSFMLSFGQAPSENSGAVLGATLAWSGNYSLKFDTNHSRKTSIIAGINEDASQYVLMPKEVFRTPELAITYSMEGKGGVSRNFHRWARNHKLAHGTQLRDVLLNSWEGVYLNVNQEVMNDMMSDFSKLGGELFVMDDGWFGNKYARKTDSSGLGDWEVDVEKLPQGIGALIASAKNNNIKFGIWIEPEMVNSKSELYEKHPDWIICQNNRTPEMGRGGTQLVLDLSNPKVQDFVFGIVDDLMTKYPQISYIKWDANMNLHNYGSYYLPKDKQSHLYIDYHRGLIKVLQRIQAKYPNLAMQACGGGGGRTNYGVLPYFDEFWASDNTDALQRIYIQWGVSHYYPASAIAAHVSAEKNHQSGRIVPLKYRFDVAMSGRLGMEMQPKDIPDNEKDFARKAFATYKEIRPIVQLGDQYRLISPYERQGVASLMYISEDKKDAVFFAYRIENLRCQLTPPFKMQGLDPNKKYKLEEINYIDKKLNQHEKVISGKYLMEQGVSLNLGDEYSSMIIRLKEI
ncbi:alpha-galactosidase [Dysgonomonas sp. 216]|uniref:alpha-galactosidase n=1 Tax=Dysgonomonas sp. 216 TaxID=2302934 RepID=UPI0013D43E83|nr:alpha-galactosidase [Dysgonomonas sp. 216]NDW18351.1 alpha-galactosidase [Dysgonomonas sp. 216]NDW18719.1 alpha-galactosidase [Dysgonomonas sp. 216]